MDFRFQKRIRIFKGLALNLSKSGSSWTLGHRANGGRWCWLARACGSVVGTSPSFWLSRRALHTVAKESNVKPIPPQPATVQDCCTGKQQL